LSSSAAGLQHVVQLVDQLGRQRGEIVDEIERVLDLVRDAGGELAERGELLGLHQAVLRGAQVVERLRQLPRCAPAPRRTGGVLDGDHGLVGERSRVFACTSSNRRTFSIAITAWSAKV
jgi:hypothetical protein